MLDAIRTCTTPYGDCAAELLEHRHDGRVKLFVVARGLAARAGRRSVFERGEYVPLQPAGGRRESVFAFARRDHTDVVIACVPRLVASLSPHSHEPPVGRTVWGDTRIELPDASEYSQPFRNAFTDAVVEPDVVDGQRSLPAAQVFERFPVALLVGSSNASAGRTQPD